MKANLKLLAVLIVSSQASSWADTCPPPPSSIDPAAAASVSYDRKSGLYTYGYTLQSGPSSQIPIDFFILQLTQAPSSVQSPAHWLPDLNTTPSMPVHFRWMGSGSNDLEPGHRLSGFSFQSTQPPGIVLFNAEGRTGVPSSSPPPEGSFDDEPEPNCPDWDFDNPRFKTIVTGITTGPLPPNTISVSIRLREGTGAHSLPPANPNNMTGKLGVLVLASKTFDPGQIVTSSIAFGPDGAAPVSSTLVGLRDDDDRDADREEWEKLSRGLSDGHDQDRDKDPKKQNLLLIFDSASLGVQCVLDKAIVLTGKTQSGANVIGGASTHFVGCDVRHPGKHHRKPDSKALYSTFKKLHRLDRSKGKQ